jgi:hypothetical protein
MTWKYLKNDLKEKEKEKEHFASILFTFQKTYEEKFPKMAKKWLEIPLKVQKITPKVKKWP